MTPVSLDRVVRTCLAKNPDDRFQTAHDVMLALQWIRDEQTNPSAPLPMARARKRMWRERAAWAIALVVAIAAATAIAMWSRREIDSLRQPIIAAIVPPRGLRFVFTGDYAGSPVLSHDGRRVAFTSGRSGHPAIAGEVSFDSFFLHLLSHRQAGQWHVVAMQH